MGRQLLTVAVVTALTYLGGGRGVASPRAPEVATVLGMSALNLAPATGGWNVCRHGDVTIGGRQAGTWTYAVEGMRGAAAYEPLPVFDSATSIDICELISRDGATTGDLVIGWFYTGIGGDVLAASVGTISWDPVLGGHTSAVDITPYP